MCLADHVVPVYHNPLTISSSDMRSNTVAFATSSLADMSSSLVPRRLGLLLRLHLLVHGRQRRQRWCQDVAAQVEFESKVSKWSITFQLQALSSRRFQPGFDRVNLHRPTRVRYTAPTMSAKARTTATTAAWFQGLTLVHFSAQPEPFLTTNTPYTPHDTPLTPHKQPIHAPPVPQKALKLS